MRLGRLLEPERYLPALWDLRHDGEACAHWVEMFRLQSEDAVRRVESRADPVALAAAREARKALLTVLDQLDPGRLAAWPTVHSWTLLRDRLLREHGVPDPYRELKAEENLRALPLLPLVLDELRRAPDLEAELRLALAGVFAGNLFDMGSPRTALAQAQRGAGFLELRHGFLARPWFRDDSAALADRLRAASGRGLVVLLADNAGADFVLGLLPLALRLAERGHEVVLAANEEPSLNDVTRAELALLLARAAAFDPTLAQLIESRRLRSISTGTGSPGIDLGDIGAELDAAVEAAWLLVLEGQGRAVETNWRALLALPVLRLATLKDVWVARALGAEVYDVVCDLRDAGAAAPAPALR